MKEKEKESPGKQRNFSMAEHIKQQTHISVEEVLKTEIIINQALIDILITKQIITEEELVDNIQKIRQEQEKIFNDQNKIVSIKS